ncbi:MAG: hypothetical protein HQK86_03180 [Nitrospinae bacterium]|nr:hypothetical protein [Nitrospinota bacterium]
MKYTVKRPILRNGKRYEAGESLDVPEKEASSLLGIGALAPNPTPPVSGPGHSKDKSGPPEGPPLTPLKGGNKGSTDSDAPDQNPPPSEDVGKEKGK